MALVLTNARWAAMEPTAFVRPVISVVAFDALIADKTFYANGIVQEMGDRGARVIVHKVPSRCLQGKRLPGSASPTPGSCGWPRRDRHAAWLSHVLGVL